MLANRPNMRRALINRKIGLVGLPTAGNSANEALSSTLLAALLGAGLPSGLDQRRKSSKRFSRLNERVLEKESATVAISHKYKDLR